MLPMRGKTQINQSNEKKYKDILGIHNFHGIEPKFGIKILSFYNPTIILLIEVQF